MPVADSLLKAEKRNILFIATSDQTGANMPLIKIATALDQQGHKVQVLVKDKNECNPLVTQLPARSGFVAELGNVIHVDGSKALLERDLKYLFNSINEENSYQDVDVVLQHLWFNPHIIFVGITFDFLTSTDILHLAEATRAVVYNVAVDMNHFTGGCHFAWDCEGYMKSCDTVDCPAILDPQFKYIASRNFLIKKENIEKGNMKVLAGTAWTKKQAARSSLYKEQDQLFNIPALVDTSIYNMRQRHIAKEAFGLSKDKFYILAGAENTVDERKGYAYFVATINLFWSKLLPEQREKVEVLSITKILDEGVYDTIKFNKKLIAYIKDERLLSSLYQAADVYVNCSVEDSGPAMLIEAAACGTPVVSFNMGAAQEFVLDGVTGWVVKSKDTAALAEVLDRVYKMPAADRLKMGEEGYSLVQENGSLTKALDIISEILAYHAKDFGRFRKSIAVAMCTYNGEKYIAEQLDSILQQHLPPDEIIICDDGSTDNTLQIIEAYQKQNPGIIKLYSNKVTLGVVKNFEKAINLCSKEIVFLCDQDDIWLPQKTEVAVRIFNRFPEVDAVCHNLKLCKENKELLPITMWDTMGFQHFLNNNYQSKDYLFHAIFFGNMVTGAAFCMRRPETPVVFRDHIPGVIHDYQLAIAYLSRKTMYFHNEYLGLYRQHENQQIGAKVNDMAENTENIRLYYEVANPFKNLLYMKDKMKHEYIFNYLEATEDESIEKMIRGNIRVNVANTLRPKRWRNQLQLMSGKLEKARADNNKLGYTTAQLYLIYARGLYQNILRLLNIYWAIFYTSFLSIKRVSIFRLLTNRKLIKHH